MIGELEFILKTAQNLIRQRKLAPAETLLLEKYKKWGNHPLINLALGEIFFLKIILLYLCNISKLPTKMVKTYQALLFIMRKNFA